MLAWCVKFDQAKPISYGCLNKAVLLGIWPNKDSINNPQLGDPDYFVSYTNMGDC